MSSEQNDNRTESPEHKEPETWKPSPKQAAFLGAYAICGNITKAAEIAKVHPDTPRCHWKDEPGFVAAMEKATEEAADRLESEARRRAEEGVDEPVFYKGEVCGTVRKYSDTLLIFLLKGVRPGKFRENTTIDGNLTLSHAVVVKGVDTSLL